MSSGSYLLKKRDPAKLNNTSVGNCAIGLEYLKISVTGIYHEIPCYACRGVDGIVTVCSHAKIRLSTFCSGEKSITGFGLILVNQIDKCWERHVQSTIACQKLWE